MVRSPIAWGRWLVPALSVLLFLLAFLLAFSWSLPGSVVVSAARSALAGSGLDVTARSARFVFPFSVRLDNAAIGPPGMEPLAVDRITAGWEPTGLPRWLPGRLRVTRGQASMEMRTSPAFWSPGKVLLSLSSLGSDDLSPLLPPSPDFAFSIDGAEIGWTKTSSGRMAGQGSAAIGLLRFPVPAADSPVKEATLTDVRLRFAVREGTLHVSSLTGTYEGARVEGTGEIAGFLHPSRSTITFHLKIQNPLEGKMATLFNLVAKNAKNANLRVTGTLLSPAGEFQFF